MDVQKMTSMAGKLETFFKVMQRIVGIAVIVVICVLTALTVANAVNPDTVIGTGFNVLEIGGVTSNWKRRMRRTIPPFCGTRGAMR